MTGYSNDNRHQILANLFNALMLIVADKKESQPLQTTDGKSIYHSIHFFGSLVKCAPHCEEVPSQSKWKPNLTLQGAVDKELLSPSIAAQNRSILSEYCMNKSGQNSNIQSFGASTISTREDDSKSISAENTICLTILTITNILQKIAIELELLCQDPESIAASDCIPNLYSQ